MADGWRDHYKELFAAQQQRAAGEPGWLRTLRAGAFARFEELGLPGRRDERWKYTSLRAFAARRPTLPDLDGPLQDRPLDSALPTLARLTNTDGQPDLGRSSLGLLPSNVLLQPVNELWDDVRAELEAQLEAVTDGLDALQLALLQGGFALRVGNDVELAEPVELLAELRTSGLIVPLVHVIDVGRHARATVVTTWRGDADGVHGGLTIARVRDGGHLEQVTRQLQDTRSFRRVVTRVDLDRDAHYHSVQLSAGARTSRDDLHIRLNGSGGHAAMTALYLGHGQRHIDHHTVVEHLVPNATSDQLYRTVLDDRSHAVFNGTIVVHRDAQSTAAEQLNNNLLLTPTARVDTRPQLQIAADDVKCGHGATIGQLDEEQLFYLMARAIPRDTAQAMLTFGFAEAAVDRIDHPTVREAIAATTRAWMATRLDTNDHESAPPDVPDEVTP